jgi:hypothetical protein
MNGLLDAAAEAHAALAAADKHHRLASAIYPLRLLNLRE